jgi:hypothetical protein
MVRDFLTQVPHANISRKHFTQIFHANISRMIAYRYVYVSVHTQERCDGNAIMVSGHNLGTLLAGNEIKWTGEEQRRDPDKTTICSPDTITNCLSVSLSLSR